MNRWIDNPRLPWDLPPWWRVAQAIRRLLRSRSPVPFLVHLRKYAGYSQATWASIPA
jgi:hypothetical protein